MLAACAPVKAPAPARPGTGHGPVEPHAEQIAGFFWANQPPGSPCLTVSVEELTADFAWHGNVENVRGDIAFAQSIVETGWFRYGGSVQCEQNNYGGLPAGRQGASFPDAETGVRAQIQHLRAYADPSATSCSQPPLATPCADPRLRPREPQGQGAELERHGQWQLGRGSRLRRQGARRLQRDRAPTSACPASDTPRLDRPERHPHRSVVGADLVEHRGVDDLDAVAHEHVVDLAVRPVRGPRAPADGAAPTGKQGGHRRAPQVEVADDHGAPVGRREPPPEIADLHRRRVRQSRAEVHGDEVEIEAADVERQVQRAPAQRRVAGDVAHRDHLDEPCRHTAHDRQADPAARPVWPRRDDVRPRLDDPAAERRPVHGRAGVGGHEVDGGGTLVGPPRFLQDEHVGVERAQGAGHVERTVGRRLLRRRAVLAQARGRDAPVALPPVEVERDDGELVHQRTA